MDIYEKYKDFKVELLEDNLNNQRCFIFENYENWLLLQNRYLAYDEQFLIFVDEHKINIPNIKTMSGQILSLFTDNRNRFIGITREMIDGFLGKLNLKSHDSIQLINKVEQRGIKKLTFKRKYYMIIYPFEYYGLHINKRQNFAHQSSDIDRDREKQINLTKEYLLFNYINVPPEQWQCGHRDPSGSNSQTNLVYQPPIQGKFRDRFKFDKVGLRLCPTLKELSKNILKYYSYEEIRSLRDLLNNFVENH